MGEQSKTGDDTAHSENGEPSITSAEKTNGWKKTKQAACYISNAIKWPFRLMGRAGVWHFKTLEPIDRFTFWVAIFTLLLVITAALQYLAFAESERTFVIAEDAYSLSGEPSQTQRFKFFITLKNVGRHPEIPLGVKVSFIEAIHKRGLPSHPLFPEYEEYNAAAVGPDSPLNITAPENPTIPLSGKLHSKEAISRILDGRGDLFVYGYIRYRTGYWVLGAGETGFCFRYVPVSQRSDGRMFVRCPFNPEFTYTY